MWCGPAGRRPGWRLPPPWPQPPGRTGLRSHAAARRWAQVKEGLGQVVLLHGEAGIGKSRLAQVLKEYVASDAHSRIECRSSPYYQHTAWYPITDLCERAWQLARDDTPEARLAKVEQALRPYRLNLAEAVPLFATLLALPLRRSAMPLTLSPQRQRQKTLETILAMVLSRPSASPSSSSWKTYTGLTPRRWSCSGSWSSRRRPCACCCC